MAEPVLSAASGSMSSRRKAAHLLVAVAVVAAILAGVLAPRHGRHAHSAVVIGEGAAGTVHVVDKASTTAGPDVVSALLRGNEVPAPAAATATVAPSTAPSPAKSSGGIGGGLLSGLLGGASQSTASAPTAASTITARGWAALEAAGATVCSPRNGSELVEMVTYGPCTVITLRPSATYNVTKTMNVTSTKIIVGNPVFLPTLTPVKGVTRLFDGACGWIQDPIEGVMHR
jgi:hypothetical protein